MRSIACVGSLLFLFGPAFLGGATAQAGPNPPDRTEHPGNVALIQNTEGYAYVHFPANVRLYVYDRDDRGRSLCDVGCASAWPPLIAAENDPASLGDWSVVMREDGRRQWAYKGKPVYLRFHDSVEAPAGNGIDGVWHYLEP